MPNATPSTGRVAFIHIPKTAGSTLYRILENHYRWDDIYTVWQDGTLDQFKQLSPMQKRNIRLLRGHVGLGIAAHLPGPTTYFTVLRDPVERVISYYHFIRRSPHHYCYELVTSRQMSLHDFVSSGADTLVDNGQTRLLANLETGHEIPFGGCDAALLDEAKANLAQRMAVVGLTERFDETLLLLRHHFGWRHIYYARQNVSANRTRRHSLSPDTLALIENANRLDTELYRFADRLFAEQVAQLGGRLPQNLRTFRQRNRRLGAAVNLYWSLRRVPVRTTARRLLQKVRGAA